MPLSNLRRLKDDMIKMDWVLCAFPFTFNQNDYIVVVRRFVEGGRARRNEYALVSMHFMRVNNMDDVLHVEANSNSLIIDAQTLREYFRINYAPNLGDILQQFYGVLDGQIPDVININNDGEMAHAMLRILDWQNMGQNDGQHCGAVRRNYEGRRTSYNSEKARILRPDLYEYFKDDDTISFCFYLDENMGRDDQTIITNFARNQNRP